MDIKDTILDNQETDVVKEELQERTSIWNSACQKLKIVGGFLVVAGTVFEVAKTFFSKTPSQETALSNPDTLAKTSSSPQSSTLQDNSEVNIKTSVGAMLNSLGDESKKINLNNKIAKKVLPNQKRSPKVETETWNMETGESLPGKVEEVDTTSTTESLKKEVLENDSDKNNFMKREDALKIRDSNILKQRDLFVRAEELIQRLNSTEVLSRKLLEAASRMNGAYLAFQKEREIDISSDLSDSVESVKNLEKVEYKQDECEVVDSELFSTESAKCFLENENENFQMLNDLYLKVYNLLTIIQKDSRDVALSTYRAINEFIRQFSNDKVKKAPISLPVKALINYGDFSRLTKKLVPALQFACEIPEDYLITKKISSCLQENFENNLKQLEDVFSALSDIIDQTTLLDDETILGYEAASIGILRGFNRNYLESNGGNLSTIENNSTDTVGDTVDLLDRKAKIGISLAIALLVVSTALLISIGMTISACKRIKNGERDSFSMAVSKASGTFGTIYAKDKKEYATIKYLQEVTKRFLNAFGLLDLEKIDKASSQDKIATAILEKTARAISLQEAYDALLIMESLFNIHVSERFKDGREFVIGKEFFEALNIFYSYYKGYKNILEDIEKLLKELSGISKEQEEEQGNTDEKNLEINKEILFVYAKLLASIQRIDTKKHRQLVESGEFFYDESVNAEYLVNKTLGQEALLKVVRPNRFFQTFLKKIRGRGLEKILEVLAIENKEESERLEGLLKNGKDISEELFGILEPYSEIDVYTPFTSIHASAEISTLETIESSELEDLDTKQSQRPRIGSNLEFNEEKSLEQTGNSASVTDSNDYNTQSTTISKSGDGSSRSLASQVRLRSNSNIGCNLGASLEL